MRDSQNPTGFQKGKMRLVESAHRLASKAGSSALKSVSLPVTSVVDADIKNMKLSLREDFKIGKFLDESVLKNENTKSTSFNTECLAVFSTNLAKLAEQKYLATSAAFEEFLSQLLVVLQKRDKMDSMYE